MKRGLLIVLILGVLLITSCALPIDDTETKYAYFEIFQAELWYDQLRFVAVDLSDTKIKDKDAVYDLIEAFCMDKSTVFVRGSNVEGYEYGSESVIYTFKDIRLTNRKLVTEVSKVWILYDGGFGTKITVVKKSGNWAITDMAETWIS